MTLRLKGILTIFQENQLGLHTTKITQSPKIFLVL